jgi:predicted Ser/Thr protein kinase
VQSGHSQLERGAEIGGYRIDGLISRGGMGVVYRATQLALNRIYALKVLAPELSDDEKFRERFKREMRIAASLHHPNIVGIHYAGEDLGLLFFVMDFIQGSDLREVIERTGAIHPERAVELLSQCASALDTAHSRGLVHRDVKPANILITVRDGEERAYLTDFGVARRSDTMAGLTAQGALVGTVDYMAPEQVNGAPSDARTDIYALGCVFFQMLTGRVPYERENSIAKLFAHVHDAPPAIEGDLAELYPAFGAVIEKAMAKDPPDRYQSAGDFARDAEAALTGLRYTGPPTRVATGEALAPEEPTATGVGVPTTPATEPAIPPPPATQPSAPPEPERVAPPAAPAAETIAAAAPADLVKPPPASATAAPASARSLSRFRRPALAVVAVIVAAAVVVIAVSSGGSSNKPSGAPFAAVAGPVPTNHVDGASGTATVHLEGNVVTASVDTNGLLKGAPHLIHIHAGGQGICPPASAASLHNGHLSISTTDGIKFYGPPMVALTNFGDTSADSRLAFARYPAVGDIRYERAVTVPSGIAAAIRNSTAVIVVHGIDYNQNGIYDNVLDRSELDSAFPGEATAPALCGALRPSQSAHAAGGTVYTASMRLVHLRAATLARIAGANQLTPAERFWLLCHPPRHASSDATRPSPVGSLAAAT